jgi:hypothetical protein
MNHCSGERFDVRQRTISNVWFAKDEKAWSAPNGAHIQIDLTPPAQPAYTEILHPLESPAGRASPACF